MMVDATVPEPHLKRSRDYYLRAIELDPGYALGHQGLGEYYGFASAMGFMRPDEGWPKAEAAMAKALALDETLPEVHNGLAALKMFYYRDWQAAEAEVARAVELDPNFPEIHALHSFYLAATGQFDQAIAECKRALKIDPLSPRYHLTLGWWLYLSRAYDEAVEELHQAFELDPTNPAAQELLGEVYALKGLHDEAVVAWKKAMTITGDHELASIMEEAHRRDGFPGAARAVASKRLERLADRKGRGEYVSAIEFARAYTQLGDRDQALAWLERASEERTSLALLIGVNPAFDELREDPRFQEIVGRLGLPS
jgi:tetratricopeptide (TPR) repeat protein